MCCCTNDRQSKGSKKIPSHSRKVDLKVHCATRRIREQNRDVLSVRRQNRPRARNAENDLPQWPSGETYWLLPSLPTESSAGNKSESDRSAISRMVDGIRNQVEADQQQREDLEHLQHGMSQLRHLNNENEQALQHLLSMRANAWIQTMPMATEIHPAPL